MRPFRHAAVLAASLAILPAPSSAGTAADFKVEGKLLGKPQKSKVGFKKAEDISGIACATPRGYPRSCLVIDDNGQFAQAVILDRDRLEAGPTIQLNADTFAGRPLELDGEGVAFADGLFYLIGSHGAPRRPKETGDPEADELLVEARVKASSQIARVRMAPDGSLSLLTPLSLTEAIAGQPDLLAASHRRLDDNGLTIEGVAVVGDRLFAGFRGPTLPGGRAPVLSVSLKGLLGQGPLDPHLFKLPLGDGRGIRDMTLWDGRILLLAGPSGGAANRTSIVLWDARTDDGVRELFDLRQGGVDPARKAEALLGLDDTPAGLRVLVMFDGEKEGAPIVLNIPKR